ncbi:hypothetical protein LJK87_37985 [Paenibacillus sp. P25]|nr:hypothetical protein LJK87_37985 [Paenibacillus sp. P25]
MPEHLKETPEWCKRMPSHIQQAATKEALLSLWHRELEPYNLKALWAALAGGRKAVVAYKLKEELTKLIGTEDMNALMSNFRGSSSLESLGPILGISRILKGEMRREEYRQRYGHRGPHEFELSVPHPGEEPAWLETQLEEFRKNGTDVEDLLGKQRSRYEEAWNRLEKEYPGKAKGMAKKLAKVAQNARLREAVRSEWTRVFRVNRAFAVRAGELTGIGDDVFFLYMDEVLRLLAGDDSAVRHIPARQETYRKYKALPAFPAVIRGRFDPFRWAEDPNRRADYYDPALPISASESETLRGFAGAAGRIEGIVRVLADPEDGAQLQPGEILVASTTNVGWTPLFPGPRPSLPTSGRRCPMPPSWPESSASPPLWVAAA